MTRRAIGSIRVVSIRPENPCWVGIEVMGGEQRAPRGEAVALGEGIGCKEGPGYEAHGVSSAGLESQVSLTRITRLVSFMRMT